MLYDPRDYQQEGLDQILHHYERGKNRLLGHAATGLGKTVIALHIPRLFPDLVKDHGMIFVAHRREILFQAYEKFEKIYGGEYWLGMEMGNQEPTGLEDIIFVSVASLGRLISNRLDKYSRRKFGAIIVDEGHHATEDSTWDNILTYFGVGSDPAHHYMLADGSKPLSLFLTATPNRNDDKSLEPLVDEVAFSYPILYGIRNGWLTDIKAHQIVDKSGVTGGDQAHDSEIDFLARIVRDWATDHKTLLFARDVQQSELLANTLNRYSIVRAGHVDAMTDDETRAELVDRFVNGDLDLMSNRLVFTEGFDNPGITCLIDNGPTNSHPLHVQKIGRGLRPHGEARVDNYKTAAERRQAIANSPKPYLTYLATFDPTKHGLDVVAAIRGKDGPPIDCEGSMVVSEVVDVLEKMEEEQPERPTKEIHSLSDIEIALMEADLWTQTIYNDELKALTPLRWVMEGDNAAIMLSRNPLWQKMGGKAWQYKQVPTVVEFRKNGEGWNMVVTSGGWNGKYPVRNRTVEVGKAYNIQRAIRKFDDFLRNSDRKEYDDAKRPSPNAAQDWQITYMKNHGIDYNAGITAATASILIDNYRIKQKING